jgi:hypothetical protein
MVRRQISRHRRPDEGPAGIVEAVAQRGIAGQHDIDDALRRVGKQFFW